MTGFTIQKRISGDQVTATLKSEVRRVTRNAFFFSPESISRDVVASLNDVRNPAFLVWKRDSDVKTLAGYVVTKVRTEMLWVSFLAVTSSEQGKGLGTLLMQKVFQAARNAGLMVSLMYKRDEDHLMDFYSKFKPIIHPRFFLWDWLFNCGYAEPVFDPQISLAAIEENWPKRLTKQVKSPHKWEPA